MGLIDVQAVLVRLYTDSAYRARFFAAPDAACADLPLTREERSGLAGLDRAQVERFARSLRQKRLAEARAYLPALAGTLGDRLPERFFAYCDAHPSGEGPLEDAQGFAAFLGASPDASPFLADLAACERLRLQVLHAAGDPEEDPAGPPAVTLASRPRLTLRAVVAPFRYDMERLYPLSNRGEAGNPAPEPGFLLIGKVRDTGRVRLQHINETTAALLRSCDGTRPLAKVVDGLAAGLCLSPTDRERFRAECLAFLQPLAGAGLIHIED